MRFKLALVIWKDHVFEKVKDRLVRLLLELITKERDGEMINNTVVAGVIQSFGNSLFFLLWCVCVCVCVREREREREKATAN